MADLLVRGVEEAVVRALKKRAGEHGRSADAKHRAILTAVLSSPPRRKLADLLASMPDVGHDVDFARQPEGGGAGASRRDMPRSPQMNQKAPKDWLYLSGVAIQAQLRAFAA
jgi:plasmid stability protein